MLKAIIEREGGGGGGRRGWYASSSFDSNTIIAAKSASEVFMLFYAFTIDVASTLAPAGQVYSCCQLQLHCVCSCCAGTDQCWLGQLVMNMGR